MRFFNLFNAFSIKMQELIMGTAVLLMALLMIANVFCRFLLGFSLAFAGEVTQFCIVAITFVGMAYAANKARHIRMTAIYDQLPKRIRKFMLIGIQILTLGVMLVMTFYSADYLYSVYQLGAIYPATRIPFFVVYSIVPIGFLLTAAEYIAAIYQNFCHPGDLYTSANVIDNTNVAKASPEVPQQ